MSTIIVPVDFSDTSLHAARYAAQYLNGQADVTVILYHHYTKESDKAAAEQKLEELKSEMTSGKQLQVETMPYHGDDFIEDLDRAVRHKRANLVIMGITGRNPIAQVFIGSNTLKMAKKRSCPVMIIPEEATYRPVKNVMLSSDFKDARVKTPSAPIKEVLKFSNPNLHVVNVDPEHYIALTDVYVKEKQDLQELFAEYNPEFYFMRLFDVDEALNLFAEEKNIDMIIVVEQDSSFLQDLFKRSRTRSLSYQSNVPILIVHE